MRVRVKYLRNLILCLLALLPVMPARAQMGVLAEDAQISVLTVHPRDNEIYTVYGHTALRVKLPTHNIDLVYNWGTFDFETPFFLWRFVKGETDYYLSVYPFVEFDFVYRMGNSTVEEQVLDLTVAAKHQLLMALVENQQPDNLEYRYNFLLDNCTTRIRDLIEEHCGGELIYPAQEQPYTYRELIHSCSKPYPWMNFGIDLVIGAPADSLIGIRDELFLPEHLMKALDQAMIRHSDGLHTRLVTDTSLIMAAQEEKQADRLYFWEQPTIVAVLLLAFLIVMAILGWRNKRAYKGIWITLFALASLTGCVVTFMSFVSEHPCVFPNWNVLWLHPLHLIALIGCFFKKCYPLFRWYHLANLVLLSILLLGWLWIPQQLNVASIPFALCLWVASGYSLIQQNYRDYE